MVTFSHSDWIAHEAKMTKAFKKSNPEAASRETGKGGLHEQIMDYCNAQWPRWRYIHSRTDQKSTVAVGAPDFVLFLPGGRTVLIECKAKGGKFSNEQLAWAKELSVLGHGVHVVFSLEEFKRVVE